MGRGPFLVTYLLRSGDSRVYLLQYVSTPRQGTRILFIDVDRIIDYMVITSCIVSDIRKEIGFLTLVCQ